MTTALFLVYPADRGSEKLTSLIRCKQYIKASEVNNPSFKQPYAAASYYRYRMGYAASWSECNSVAVADVAQCGIACSYCFCPQAATEPSRILTPEDLYREFNQADEVAASAVWRLSGGEPLLFPDFVADFFNIARTRRDAPYLKLSTNLLGAVGPLPHVMHALAYDGIGVIGCFKGLCGRYFEATQEHPVDGTRLLDRQIERARELVDAGVEVFFRIIALAPPEESIEDVERETITFIARLRHEVDMAAPLRTEVVRLKRYAWQRHWHSLVDVSAIWEKVMAQFYEPLERWGPTNLIAWRGRA